MSIQICRSCNASFEHSKRGRPASKCEKCRVNNLFNEGSNVSPDVIGADVANTSDTTEVDQFFEEAFLQNEEDSSKHEDRSIPADNKRQSINGIALYKDPMAAYRVIVTNFGFPYQGNSLKEAQSTFKEYVHKSVLGFGQIGLERVSLFHLEEKVDEFDPAKEKLAGNI